MEQTDLFNLGRYRIKTYNVSLVSESPAAVTTLGQFTGTGVKSSEDCYRLCSSLYRVLGLDADREHFTVVCLNNKHRIEGFKVVSTGSLSASLVHPREVYHAAITLRAAAIILVHNHPSGDPAPSQDDIELTRRLKEIGDIMAIRVLDHVILGQEKWFSFSDRGML